MKDELDGLSDEALSEAFALAFTHWRQVPLVRGDRTRGIVARFEAPTTKSPGAQPRTPSVIRYKDGKYGGERWPSFATSADAVLEHLYKHHWDSAWDKVSCIIRIFKSPRHIRDDGHVWAHALTLPRAACISLLRASRAQKP